MCKNICKNNIDLFCDGANRNLQINVGRVKASSAQFPQHKIKLDQGCMSYIALAIYPWPPEYLREHVHFEIFCHRSSLFLFLQPTDQSSNNTKYKRSHYVNSIQYSIIRFNQAHHCSLISSNYQRTRFFSACKFPADAALFILISWLKILCVSGMSETNLFGKLNPTGEKEQK